MAVLYKQTKYDTPVDPESLTEQEHKDSCDINKMIKNIHRGLEVRGGSQPIYGHDDTTMDPVRFRIEKEKIEADLQNVASSHEFTDEELEQVPPDVQKKFGFKKKQKSNQVPKNDDQTTNQEPKNTQSKKQESDPS